eukprot:jgi/Mesvir1/26598/Mv09569-RA.1
MEVTGASLGRFLALKMAVLDGMLGTLNELEHSELLRRRCAADDWQRSLSMGAHHPHPRGAPASTTLVGGAMAACDAHQGAAMRMVPVSSLVAPGAHLVDHGEGAHVAAVGVELRGEGGGHALLAEAGVVDRMAHGLEGLAVAMHLGGKVPADGGGGGSKDGASGKKKPRPRKRQREGGAVPMAVPGREEPGGPQGGATGGEDSWLRSGEPDVFLTPHARGVGAETVVVHAGGAGSGTSTNSGSVAGTEPVPGPTPPAPPEAPPAPCVAAAMAAVLPAVPAVSGTPDVAAAAITAASTPAAGGASSEGEAKSGSGKRVRKPNLKFSDSAGYVGTPATPTHPHSRPALTSTTPVAEGAISGPLSGVSVGGVGVGVGSSVAPAPHAVSDASGGAAPHGGKRKSSPRAVAGASISPSPSSVAATHGPHATPGAAPAHATSASASTPLAGAGDGRAASTPSAVTGTPAPQSASPDGGLAGGSGNKRQRKPNPKYMDEEAPQGHGQGHGSGGATVGKGEAAVATALGAGSEGVRGGGADAAGGVHGHGHGHGHGYGHGVAAGGGRAHQGASASHGRKPHSKH